ncbi:MAG: nuclease-related domain-containing protein [Mycobacteriales bacterium]
MTAPVPATVLPRKLRYAGKCHICTSALAAGTPAFYDRTTRKVTCLACAEGADVATKPVPAQREAPAAEEMAAQPPAPADVDQPDDPGTAGASARREHARRLSRGEARTRAAHPRLGGLVLALSKPPQSTQAWAVGARGEELLAKRLDGLADKGVRLLHDRRIRGTVANIDHIAIAPVGVFVIDAKRYKGRPRLQVDGGQRRPRTEKLIVASRDCTKVCAGVKNQVQRVRDALERNGLGAVPVTGMLCFVEADWPAFGGSFVIDGLHVLWPRLAVKHLLKPGMLGDGEILNLQRVLAAEFPIA